MTKSHNPFENPKLKPKKRHVEPTHPSDDPGRDYPSEKTPEDEPHHSSGPSSPSEPRRSGTGERQAPRRHSDELLTESDPLIPGEVIHCGDDVEINAGLEVTTLRVENTADRPVQVGSHFHFAEVNAALDFDRSAAWGKRLNVLSGGAMRFEPGAAEEVELIPIRGRRIVPGLRGLCGGKLDE